jgi:hypothetical protein
MFKPKIDSSNLIYLSICIAGIITFLLVGLLPNVSALDQIEKGIVTLQQQTDAQALLNPVYRKLIEEIQIKSPGELALPQPGKIERGNIVRLNEALSGLSRANEVAFHNAVPDASSYRDDSNRFIVNASFSGDFFNFRGLLMDICKLPYLESIENIRIETDQENKKLMLKMEFIQ